jgi:hypothetical protein
MCLAQPPPESPLVKGEKNPEGNKENIAPTRIPHRRKDEQERHQRVEAD